MASVEWEQKAPLVMVHVLQRGVSDRTSLLLDSDEAACMSNKVAFSFELGLFQRVSFIEIVATKWAKENRGNTTVERWQYKIQHLCNSCGVEL